MKSDISKGIISDWKIPKGIILSLIQCNGFPLLVPIIFPKDLIFETTDDILMSVNLPVTEYLQATVKKIPFNMNTV